MKKHTMFRTFREIPEPSAPWNIRYENLDWVHLEDCTGRPILPSDLLLTCHGEEILASELTILRECGFYQAVTDHSTHDVSRTGICDCRSSHITLRLHDWAIPQEISSTMSMGRIIRTGGEVMTAHGIDHVESIYRVGDTAVLGLERGDDWVPAAECLGLDGPEWLEPEDEVQVGDKVAHWDSGIQVAMVRRVERFPELTELLTDQGLLLVGREKVFRLY